MYIMHTATHVYMHTHAPSAHTWAYTADTSKDSVQMPAQVSPITGELVAISEMAEHMRVSLIDPRWKEQREAMLSRLRDTTRASDDEIARNLVGLAGTRPDIFGECMVDKPWCRLLHDSAGGRGVDPGGATTVAHRHAPRSSQYTRLTN